MAEENITTRFKVDVSDLKAGITEANKQMKLANAEFKKAASGMDDWSKSSTGIAAKLKQLDSILASQKAKVHNYNEQLQRQKEAYAENGNRADQLRAKLKELADQGVSKTSEEYKKYQAELTKCEKEQLANQKAIEDLNITILNQEAAVNKTEKEMADFTQELDRVEVAEKEAAKSGKSVDDVLKEMEQGAKEAEGGFTVLKGTLANLAAAGIQRAIEGLKDLGRAMYDAWQEYDEGADIIITKTGATGDAAEDLMNVYKNVSKNVVGDFNTLGTAVGEVNTRFGLTGDELQELSERFLKFAKINGTDVNNSIDKTQAAMAAWGIEAKDAGLMLDTLNKAGQDTGVNVDKLAESMVTLAPSMQEMGFSASDAAMFLANLDKSGVDASATMTGMKKALVNAAKEGKPVSEAMAEMEDSIKNASSSTEAITIATELFGSKAGASIATAVRDGKLSFADLGTSMKDFEGNVNSTFEDTLDAPDRFALAIQGIRTEMADTTGDLMSKYAPQIMGTIESIGDKLEGFFGIVEKTVDFFLKYGNIIIATVAGIGTAIGVLALQTLGISGLAAAFMNLSIVQKAVTAAQWLMNAAMTANPIGLVVAAVAALVVAFIVLWKRSEKFRAFWLKLWEKVKNAVIPVIKALTKWFKETWDAIKKVWDKALPFFKAVWEGIKNVFSVVSQVLGGFFKAAWTAVKNAWNGAVAFFTKIWNDIKTATLTIWNAIVSAVNSIVNGLKNTITSVFNAIKSAVTSVWNSIKSTTSSVWNGIKSTISSVVNGIKSAVSSAVNSVKSTVSSVWNSIKSTTSSVWNGIKSAITTPINAAKDAVKSVIDKIKGFFNFKISWPKIPLPHFSISPAGWKIGDLLKGTIPKLGISWYKTGGVFDRPTVLTGLGENGAEAIVPLERNKQWIHAVAEDMKAELMAMKPTGNVNGNINNSKTQNFTQIINAPKQPSRIELYRQTKNLLSLAKEGL